MNKHTPGPWKVYDDGSIYTADGLQVLASYADSDGHYLVATDADRRLAAAAPELLEACESVIRTVGRVHAADCIIDSLGEGCICHVDKLRAAIAKARGQS